MEGNNRDKAVADLEKILGENNDLEGSAIANVRQLLAQLGIAAKKTGFDRNERLLKGIEHFKTEKYEKNIALFERLAQTQTPKFLVFACCESHVSPSHVLNFQLGEAVIFRNLANIVPPFDEKKLHSDQVDAATIEYAVVHQQVESILVIVHSRCEVINRLMSIADDGTSRSTIDSWVKTCEAAKLKVLEDCKDLVLMRKTLTLKGGYYNTMNGNSQLWNFCATVSTSDIQCKQVKMPKIEPQHPSPMALNAIPPKLEPLASRLGVAPIPSMVGPSASRELKLDELRKEIASLDGGIFPHSVLSTQQVSMLAANTPKSLEELEKIIGKLKAEKYGTKILDAINSCRSNHGNDDNFSGGKHDDSAGRAAKKLKTKKPLVVI